MNSWVAALIGAGVMYVVACIVTIADEWWLDDKFVAPFSAVGIVVMFIPCMLWGFIRHVVSPIPVERQNDPILRDIIKDAKQITPTLYYYHDRNAKRIVNRRFLFRLKK